MAVTIMVGTTVLSSCEYKDLGDFPVSEKIRVGLHFDWKNVDSIPKSMRVVFYPENYETYARGYTFYDVLNRDTTIQITTGTYDVTAWNRDTEYVITGGYSRKNTAFSTTGEYSPHGSVAIPHVLDSIYGGQKVLDYPDYMVHGNLTDCELKSDTTITVTPDSMVVTVEVRLNGIRSLELVRNIRGAINNVAGRRYMAYDNLTDNLVAVMYDGKRSIENNRIVAKFWVFGIEPTDESKIRHKVVFFIWLDNGQVYIPVDVTEAVARYSKDDKYILIETKDLDIDLAEYMKAGGMSVNAEDWDNTEEIHIAF